MRDNHDITLWAQAWPGNSTFVDFLNENAQSWWSSLFPRFEGVNQLFYHWNDVNDPCVFNGYIKTMPNWAEHIKADGTRVNHGSLHSAYCLFEHRASLEGMRRRNGNNLRPFVLSRSFFFGSQRLGPSWTGDTQAQYVECRGSVQEMLAQGVSGYPFTGADIPGYKLVPPDDLFIMLYQLGVFYPFMRAHNEINYQAREPWIQTQRVQDVIRDSIMMRYDLIHYIYNLFYFANVEGRTIFRPMWQVYPKDRSLFRAQDQFMFGDALLVCPKLTPKNETNATYGNDVFVAWCSLPEFEKNLDGQEIPAIWYYWYTKEAMAGTKAGEQMTLQLGDREFGTYVRGGHILPILDHDKEMSLLEAFGNSITLQVYLNHDAFANGYIYLDDGETVNN